MLRIQHPIILEGHKVKLVPLDAKYFDELLAVARNEEIWEHMSLAANNAEGLLIELKSALLRRVNGEEYPFVILDKEKGNVIGSTRYMNISAPNYKLEIGWTWNDPAYWQKGFNTESKLLLLTYAFETLHCIRVQLQTSETNTRSRKAILGIGATFEGILRKERIRYNGPRNTAMYSITDDEWPEVKAMLTEKVNR